MTRLTRDEVDALVPFVILQTQLAMQISVDLCAKVRAEIAYEDALMSILDPTLFRNQPRDMPQRRAILLAWCAFREELERVKGELDDMA